MTRGLPKGWEYTPLKDIAKVEWGNTSITKKAYTQKGYPAFSAAGQDGILENYEWEGPAVVLSAIGARCGKCFLADGKWTAIKNTIVIQGDKELINHKLLFYFLNDEKKWSISGSGQPFITMGSAQKVALPFPPLAEQRRIVAMLEVLLAKVDESKKRLERIPTILKRFRQSILAAACSGRLTEDWRKKNACIEKDANDLPDSWVKSCLGDVLESLKYGTAQKCNYNNNGVPVIRIPNIGEGIINHDDMKYTSLSTKEHDQLKLIPGDLLLIRSNGSVSLVGKTALVREGERNWAYAGYLIRLRTNKDVISPEYLHLVMSSYDVRLQIEIPARSTSGVNNINSKEVKALQIPIAPIAEQREIIRKAQLLFKQVDEIDTRYQQTMANFNKLTQSILAKAFRGELVPQDPNDEPASVLLERIKAQTKANPPIRKRRKNNA